MEEILRGNGSQESGNMQDLTFCGVEVHVPVLFPLLKFAKVFLSRYIDRISLDQLSCISSIVIYTYLQMNRWMERPKNKQFNIKTEVYID